jgi:hypothetical protein
MAAEATAVNNILAGDPTNPLERIDVEFPDFGAELDLWAEQYGDT